MFKAKPIGPNHYYHGLVAQGWLTLILQVIFFGLFATLGFLYEMATSHVAVYYALTGGGLVTAGISDMVPLLVKLLTGKLGHDMSISVFCAWVIMAGSITLAFSPARALYQQHLAHNAKIPPDPSLARHAQFLGTLRFWVLCALFVFCFATDLVYAGQGHSFFTSVGAPFGWPIRPTSGGVIVSLLFAVGASAGTIVFAPTFLVCLEALIRKAVESIATWWKKKHP